MLHKVQPFFLLLLLCVQVQLKGIDEIFSCFFLFVILTLDTIEKLDSHFFIALNQLEQDFSIEKH